MAYSLLVEETNEIRVSLGLKPIPVPSRNEFPDLVAEPKPEESRVKEEVPAPINEIPLLADSKLTSTADWLNSLGSAKESNTPESVAIVREAEPYHDRATQPTFTGAIGHSGEELSQIKSGEILTLSDQHVDQDEDSVAELSHPKIAHTARIQNTEILTRRDDGIIEKSGSTNASISVTASEANVMAISKPQNINPNRVDVRLFDADFSDDDAFQDYAETKPIKMKKIKKKNNKLGNGVRRAREIDEGEFDAPLTSAPLKEDLIEDETAVLEAELARTRHFSQKNKRLKMLSHDREQEEAQFSRLDSQKEIEGNMYAAAQPGATVISDTTEFLRLVGSNLAGSNEEVPKDNSSGVEQIKKDLNENLEIASSDTMAQNEEPNSGLEEDMTPQFNQGLGSALAYLRKNEVLPEKRLEQQIQQQRQRQQAAKRSELMRIQIAIEERVLHQDLANDKTYMNLAKRDRPEYFESRLQERIDEKGIVPLANESKNEWYDPKVQVSYRDESGQLLDTKGAFKQLSHHFHGAQKSHTKGKSSVKDQRAKLEPRVL